MKHSVIAVFLLALLSACVAVANGQTEKPWGTGKVTIEKVVDLGVDAGPARLSPDGSRVLFVERGENRTYSYCTIGADGKNKAKVFACAWKKGYPFTLVFGSGIWSPDGKQFIALTADEQEGEKPRMAICDAATGRETLLPVQKDTSLGALFGNDGAVYYVDHVPPEKEDYRCLRRYDPKTEKAEDVWKCADGIILRITMSPDRSRIGTVIVRPKPGGKGGEPQMRLWAYDLASKKTDEITDEWLTATIARVSKLYAPAT